MYRAVLLVCLLVVAGCQAPGAPTTETDPAVGGGGTDATATPVETAADAGEGGTEAAGEGGASSDAPPDPDGDRLGWENGYWHNESVDVTAGDGLDESELEAVVSRSMARIELVRELEFDEQVPVSVIDRSTYQGQSGGNHSEALARFDNAKFEALFLVGEREDAIDTQESTRGQSVLGYYSPAQDSIVLVSESDAPRLESEGTLAHELVHALQDQHFDLAANPARTRDAYQGRNGLVEGDASFTQQRYLDRCGDQWECLSVEDEGGDGAAGDAGDGVDADAGGEENAPAGHLGIQFMEYFPYSDGPGFVAALRDDGGWAAVNDAYADVPDGSPEVIYSDRYSGWEPAAVTLHDRSNGDWERVEPPGRPSHAVPGQSAIAASLAYTLFDDHNRSAVVRPTAVLNYRSDGSLNPDDPFDYDVPAAAGWTGGKLYAYENGDASGYVWKTQWTNASEAREFARAWSALVAHWGGERVGQEAQTSGGEWVIRDGEFADAVRIRQDGSTVTVVNAPDRADLSAVHDA